MMRDKRLVSKAFTAKMIGSVWIFALVVSILIAFTTATASSITQANQAGTANTSEGSITGAVVDANGPVAGATVRVQLTEEQTMSAEDGSFILPVPGSGVGSSAAVTVTAWAPGYYNGMAVAQPGAAPVTITLTSYYVTDN